MATHTLQTIFVNINGNNQPFPVTHGTTGNSFLGNSTNRDLFQIPANVDVLVNGVGGSAGDLGLRAGDVLTFQTKASSKAAKGTLPAGVKVKKAATATKKPAKASK